MDRQRRDTLVRQTGRTGSTQHMCYRCDGKCRFLLMHTANASSSHSAELSTPSWDVSTAWKRYAQAHMILLNNCMCFIHASHPFFWGCSLDYSKNNYCLMTGYLIGVNIPFTVGGTKLAALIWTMAFFNGHFGDFTTIWTLLFKILTVFSGLTLNGNHLTSMIRQQWWFMSHFSWEPSKGREITWSQKRGPRLSSYTEPNKQHLKTDAEKSWETESEKKSEVRCPQIWSWKSVKVAHDWCPNGLEIPTEYPS